MGGWGDLDLPQMRCAGPNEPARIKQVEKEDSGFGLCGSASSTLPKGAEAQQSQCPWGGNARHLV